MVETVGVGDAVDGGIDAETEEEEWRDVASAFEEVSIDMRMEESTN